MGQYNYIIGDDPLLITGLENFSSGDCEAIDGLRTYSGNEWLEGDTDFIKEVKTDRSYSKIDGYQ